MSDISTALPEVRFDEKGLVPVIAQNAANGEVLMLAYANRQALDKTIATGELHLFSRSRRQLWKKGETSGNIMYVRDIRIDCDEDSLLVLVEPSGPACHTGHRSCFYRLYSDAGEGDITFLSELQEVIGKRKTEGPEGSYTHRLLTGTPRRIAQKIGEEGVEVALALASGDRPNLTEESADLLYHLLVGWEQIGLPLQDIWSTLELRHRKP
ncbi:MAG: bifunctional phosphoribosyl-AMP cyclohydrolase/phosphoribosyl-ATP diphosphatase HisIE [Synergistales bacterium]|nr:bifunctional phosphoribosyl-AMP cyclohydrolase/phosphoribosyl-ATP diphosphatase HisIE [Synergistales bacterium]